MGDSEEWNSCEFVSSTQKSQTNSQDYSDSVGTKRARLDSSDAEDRINPNPENSVPSSENIPPLPVIELSRLDFPAHLSMSSGSCMPAGLLLSFSSLPALGLDTTCPPIDVSCLSTGLDVSGPPRGLDVSYEGSHGLDESGPPTGLMVPNPSQENMSGPPSGIEASVTSASSSKISKHLDSLTLADILELDSCVRNKLSYLLGCSAFEEIRCVGKQLTSRNSREVDQITLPEEVILNKVLDCEVVHKGPL